MNTRFNPDIVRKHDKLQTLPAIAERLDININTLNRWAEASRRNDFPEPVQRLGRYRLYDSEKVEEWVYLWLKINQNFNGNHLPNNNRTKKGEEDG